MKNLITVIAVIMLAGALMAGTVFALSADGTETDMENMEIEDGAEFVRSDIEREISFSSVACTDGNRISVIYDKSIVVYDDIIDIYADAESNQYLFNGGRLTGFLDDSAGSSENVTHRITLDEAGDIADGIVASLGLGTYSERSGSFLEAHNTYSFGYSRAVRGFAIDDEILVEIALDGELYNYVVRNNGKFDNFDPSFLDGITDESLAVYAREQAEELYSGISGFNVQYVKVCADTDGKYYISVTASVNDSDGLSFMDSFRYDIG